MAQAFLVGGTPRVGKTTLTLEFLKRQPVMATSTDAIRYMLRRVLTEPSEPDLFDLGKFTSNEPERRSRLIDSPEEIIALQNRESDVVWRATANFIRSNLEDGYDVLVEGTAVMPQAVSRADFPYAAVFLGNQSEQHVRNIVDSARNNPNDWMHNLDDETIRAFAIFNRAFSQHIQEEAEKYNLPYIEVSDDNFHADLETALRTIQVT